jgi:hypothetical protein
MYTVDNGYRVFVDVDGSDEVLFTKNGKISHSTFDESVEHLSPQVLAAERDRSTIRH